jgi:hypothetical protein
LATFTQTKPSAHAEGYGLFFGGKSLEGKDQQYTYFLIRQDGSYLIKRRGGGEREDHRRQQGLGDQRGGQEGGRRRLGHQPARWWTTSRTRASSASW